MEEVRRIMAELDWSPLWISMKTGVVATVISFFLGIYAARKSVQAGPRLKAVLDGILTLPMVLPPTVAGFFLLLIFSVRRPFGAFLYGNFDIKVVQSWAGCVIAATDRHQSDPCGADTWNVRVSYFLDGSYADRRSRSYSGNDTGICPGARRIWGDFDVGGKYSGKDGDNLPEDRDGHSGW